ncbi:MAG: hypothetical protein R3D46_17005 [Defluviimonas denitrificans]
MKDNRLQSLVTVRQIRGGDDTNSSSNGRCGGDHEITDHNGVFKQRTTISKPKSFTLTTWVAQLDVRRLPRSDPQKFAISDFKSKLKHRGQTKAQATGSIAFICGEDDKVVRDLLENGVSVEDVIAALRAEMLKKLS